MGEIIRAAIAILFTRFLFGMILGAAIIQGYYQSRSFYPYWQILMGAFVLGFLGNLISTRLPR